VLGVALRIGAALLLGLGRGVGGTGNTQVVLQFVTCELQDTIQLVVVEVTGVESPGVGTTTLGVACAKAGPDAAVTATARMILNAVITASPRCESHHTAYWQILAYGKSWTRRLLRQCASVANLSRFGDADTLSANTMGGSHPLRRLWSRHLLPNHYGRSRDHHVEVQQVRDPMLNSSSP
jgi:hypothetical protein